MRPLDQISDVSFLIRSKHGTASIKRKEMNITVLERKPISEYTSAHVPSLSISSPFPKSHAPTPAKTARKIADISEVKIAIPELLVSFW
jgi:hypothetical protein